MLTRSKSLLARAASLAVVGIGCCWFAPEAACAVLPVVADQSVDETALRYYAMLHQTARVEMESRRLKQLYPGWTPPADLWTAKPGGPEEAPLWAMFAADDIVGLKAAIAKMQSNDPAWKPSDDLLRKLRRKELRAGIVSAVAQANWEQAEKLASALDGDGPDVGLAWLLAEVFVKRDRVGDAEKMYASVLQRSSNAAERRATIQKALGNLPIANAERLLLLAKRDADGKSEFAELATDIARARIAGFLRDQSRATIAEAELVPLQELARASTTSEPAGLLAWYALKRNDPQDALTWFKLAISRGGDAMIAHGLAQTLLRLGARREAEEVAYAWRDPLINNAILFIDVLGDEMARENPPLVEPERLARYARVTVSTSSGEGAQALAWYAYNTCQFEMALAWFQRAVAWFPKEATAYGYALTLQRLKRRQEFLEIVNRYDGLFPRVVGLLFRQDRSGSPPPCDATHVRAETDEQGKGIRAGPVGRALFPDPSRYGEAGMPGGAIAPVKQSEFPVAVAAENPLRFTTWIFPPPKETPGGSWRELTPGTAPRVARRVPGVGAMPYESLGYTLRPGWDGTDHPSSPTFMEWPAIAGTLWNEQLRAAPSGLTANSQGALMAASPFEHMRGRTQ